MIQMQQFQANSPRRHPDERPRYDDVPDYAVRERRGGFPAWGWLLIGLGAVFFLGVLFVGASLVVYHKASNEILASDEIGNDPDMPTNYNIDRIPARARAENIAPRGNKTSVDEAFVTLMKNAEKASLYEGLPHQKNEPALLKKEKESKKTQIFGDFAFYEESFDLKEADIEELKSILSDPDTFQPWSGCGTYHPDYFIEWYADGEICRAYICFGCGEAKLVGPNGEMKYNYSRAARTRLENVLFAYHRNRPDSEGWLNMTKDYKARQQ